MAILDRRLLSRVFWLQLALIAAGVGGWWFARGRVALISFLAGATVAAVSFWVLARLAASFQGQRSSPTGTLLVASRLMIAGGVLYVILRTYEVHQGAIVTGLLTPVFAISLATAFELFYARTS